MADRDGAPADRRTSDRALAGVGMPGPTRTLGNAPWSLWAWPYGALVPVLALIWMLLGAGWLWMALALAGGFLVARRTWPTARG